MNRREHRRNRIHADAPSKVYTATGEKAVKVEKDEPKKPKQEPESVKLVENINAQVSVVEENDVPKPVPAAILTNEEAPKAKKRGRKPKSEKVEVETVVPAETSEVPVTEIVEIKAEQVASEPAVAAEAQPGGERTPKKRGRKAKNKTADPSVRR